MSSLQPFAADVPSILVTTAEAPLALIDGCFCRAAVIGSRLPDVTPYCRLSSYTAALNSGISPCRTVHSVDCLFVEARALATLGGSAPLFHVFSSRSPRSMVRPSPRPRAYSRTRQRLHGTGTVEEIFDHLACVSSSHRHCPCPSRCPGLGSSAVAGQTPASGPPSARVTLASLTPTRPGREPGGRRRRTSPPVVVA